jgi:hypothetical protein
MKVFKLLVDLLFITTVAGQYTDGPVLVGGTRDDHGCVLDGGFQWCDFTQSCARPWETPCVETLGVPPRPYPSPPPRPLPPTPPPPHPVDPIDCQYRRCPPPMPCPMPYMPEFNMNNCKLNNNVDECGCQTSCPSYDCRNVGCESDLDCHHDEFCRPTGLRSQIPMVNGRRLQLPSYECVPKVGINETCGGMVPPQYQTRCLDGLECVNVLGPMIADAPGECKEPCNNEEVRNQFGECIIQKSTIPDNCLTFYDGCNTCQVRDGRADICTLMYCFQQGESYCMHFSTDELRVGEICYRFCEDGSQESINRRDGCPVNTECKSVFNENSVSMISYDTCGSRAMVCQAIGH